MPLKENRAEIIEIFGRSHGATLRMPPGGRSNWRSPRPDQRRFLQTGLPVTRSVRLPTGSAGCRFPVVAHPPRLAANLLGSVATSLFTAMSNAVDPVKKVLIPSAVSVPLVSPAKANSRFAESVVSVRPPSTEIEEEISSIASSAALRLTSVVSSSSPFNRALLREEHC